MKGSKDLAMRLTSSKETARDWGWADGFLPHAKRIIGEHLLVAAPMDIDVKEASDIVFLVSGRGDVAFRVRRSQYAEKYPFDVTFRSEREGFEKTELDKICDGHARWMLYGFGDSDGKTIGRWALLDLNAFRAAMLCGKLVRPRPQRNADGTGFEVFDVRILRGIDPAIVFAASHEIPSTVGPQSQRETAREFWRRRMEQERGA
jgi:hypothetical protein